jgi:UDP-2,3-diacylglucosamine pyrophosphatase LpxH
MLVDSITMLGNIAPTEVIYISGNHDRLIGYALMKAVAMAFRKDANVTFDTASDPQKFRLVGITLIGFTHGDMPAKNMASWLQHRARKEYGMSLFAEIHAGHFHTTKTVEAKRDVNQTEDIGGIIVRYLPTICNASYWEHQQGYVSGLKSVVSFVWSEENGLREMWYGSII